MARNSLLETKSIGSLMAQTEESGHKLKRAPGALDLTLPGIGGIIGTGIFVLRGVGAAPHAGPPFPGSPREPVAGQSSMASPFQPVYDSAARRPCLSARATSIQRNGQETVRCHSSPRSPSSN